MRKAFKKLGWGLVALGVLLAVIATSVEGSETLGVLGLLASLSLAGGVFVLVMVLFDAVLDRTFDWGLDRLGLRGRRFGWSGGAIREVKDCPECVSSVPMEAKLCRHCGHRFDPSVPGD